MKRINLQRARAQIARPTTIRDINKRIVLNYVRDRAPISRADIARETALHRSTVSVIVDELIEAGLIVEIGAGDSTGGRKPTLFKLKTGQAAAIGIDLTPRLTTIAVADLAGNVLSKESFSTSPDIEFMTSQIIDRTKRIAEEYAEEGLQIGMSVPGLVDQKLGKIFHIPYFDWRDWDICQKLEAATGLEVIVENDANATALAELWFGHERIRKTDTFVTVLVGEGIGTGIIFDGQVYRGEMGAGGEFGHERIRKTDTFVTVLVGEGIGTGIIFDGQVYRGEMGAGGEFGHMIAGDNAPVECSCGSRECWEAYASENAAVERYRQLIKSSEMKQNDIDIQNIVELAANGEKHAVEALRETAKYLGNGISNLIVGLSPQVVVVSGRITKAWDTIADQLYRVAERSVLAGLPPTVLMPSSLGDSPTLIGAFGLVLARKFGSVSD